MRLFALASVSLTVGVCNPSDTEQPPTNQYDLRFSGDIFRSLDDSLTTEVRELDSGSDDYRLWEIAFESPTAISSFLILRPSEDTDPLPSSISIGDGLDDATVIRYDVYFEDDQTYWSTFEGTLSFSQCPGPGDPVVYSIENAQTYDDTTLRAGLRGEIYATFPNTAAAQDFYNENCL